MAPVTTPSIVFASQPASTSANPGPDHRTVTLSDGSFVTVFAVPTGEIRFQQFDEFGRAIGTEGQLASGVPLARFDLLAIENSELVLALEDAGGAIALSSFDISGGTATLTTTVSATLSSISGTFTGPALAGSSSTDLTVQYLNASGGAVSLQTVTGLAGAASPTTNTVSVDADPGSALDAVLLGNGNRVVVIDTNGAGSSTSSDTAFVVLDPAGAEVARGTLSDPAGGAVSKPQVVALADGGFAVAFQSDGGAQTVRLQVFNADGSARSVIRDVSDDATDANADPALVALDDGGFIAFFDRATDDTGLVAQRYDAQGVAVGDPGELAAGAGVEAPSVSLLGDGLVALTYLDGGVLNSTVLGTRALDLDLGEQGTDLLGTVDDDTVNGSTEDDTLDGADGNDLFFGDLGADLLRGGNGNDTLNGARGIDTIFGGAGDDRIIVENGNFIDDINGGGDTDTLDMSGYTFNFVTVDLSAQTYTVGGGAGVQRVVNVENVIGSDESGDMLTGNSGANRIEGRGGDDTINGFGGSDTLIGGDGDDSVTGSLNGRNLLEGGIGSDTLTGGGRNDTLIGGAGADIMDGDGGNQDLADYSASDAAVSVALALGQVAIGSGGHAEGDTLTGIEHLTGSAFDDVLSSNNNKVTIRGLDGNDSITGGFNFDRLIGGAGDDTINGQGQGDSAVFEGDLADFVIGRSQTGQVRIGDLRQAPESEGVDTTISVEFYEFADQTVTVSTVIDDTVILGTNASETITPPVDAVQVFGFGGDDVIVASAAGQRIDGGRGADTVTGSTGSDTLEGAEGRDRLSGGAGDDTVSGGDGDDIVIGGGGADRLEGDEGHDSFDGGANADRLNGGLGDDTLFGNSGFDTALYVGLSAGVFVTLESGFATGGGGDDVLASIEGVFGSGHDDVIFGSNAKGERLEGSLGHDQLSGLDGRDTLLGGDGNDTLLGGDGVDRMLGQDGDDRLEGGGGTDFMTGGAGADNFVFRSIDDTGVGRFNRDELRDFSGAEGDRINLFLIDADETVAGNQRFVFAGDSFTGSAGELILNDFVLSGVDVTIASMDVDGDGLADGQIYAVGSGITVDDFVL
ncbi:hypothetical protein [Cognatishimia sp. F0-27]|uniref:calcium-binding protein n=1 Tax=Cognatishimia sp. F0-27 TaxID=2816855 RepID=UPI001D0C63A1|nr:hypothetical protein [Cognatishimia sp. F0-27]MCC1491847.1 hypothetical protein [Cognatishimia sp. F0-27]